MKELSEITGVSEPKLYQTNDGKNISVDLINKIYEGTKKKYGIGLRAEQYTSIYIDKNANQ